MLNNTRQVADTDWRPERAEGTCKITVSVERNLTLRTIDTLSMVIGVLPEKNSRFFNELMRSDIFFGLFYTFCVFLHKTGQFFLKAFIFFDRKVDLFLKSSVHTL